MKDVYYFSHDANAKFDPKIVMMRSVYGWEGYGLYWALVETMREQDGYKISLDGKYAIDALALLLQCERTKLESFIQDCVEEFELFEKKEGLLFSLSLLNRMAIRDEKSKKAQESARKRWDKKSNETSGQDANAMRTDNSSKPNAEQPQCDGNALKEIKGKEKKGKRKESSLKTPPPIFDEWVPSEVMKKWAKRKSVSDDDLSEYTEACFDWFKSTGEKKQDWESTVKGWIRRDLKREKERKPDLKVHSSDSYRLPNGQLNGSMIARGSA